MTLRTLAQLAAVTALGLSLAACGGGKSTTQQAASAAPSAPAMQTEAQRETAALPLAQAAPVDVNCGAVKPVWVNLHTKAYHEPGDPYYGRTKNGKYMCPSQAAAQGYHPAGQRHKGTSGSTGGMMQDGSMQNGAMQNAAMPMPSATHHRRHHGGANETPEPDQTP